MSREFTQTNGQFISHGNPSGHSGATAYSIYIDFFANVNNIAHYLYQGEDASPFAVTQAFVQSNGTLRTRWDTSGGNNILDITAAELQIGQWHSYLCTYDGSNLRVYLDGAEVTNSPLAATGGLDNTPDTFRVGNVSNGTLPFDGKLCEYCHWAATLTANEAVTLANGISPGDIRPTDIEIYLPIEGNDSPELDYSPNGLSGTVNGTLVKANHSPKELWTPGWITSEIELVTTPVRRRVRMPVGRMMAM